MRLASFIVLISATCTLGACSTYADPAQLSHSGNDDALIIAERNDFGSLDLILQEVDLKNGRFKKRKVILSSSSDTVKSKIRTNSFNQNYIAERAPAGDYAIVGTIDSSFYSAGRRYGTSKKYNCSSLGASVISVLSGKTYFLKTQKGRLTRSSEKDVENADRALASAGIHTNSAEMAETISIISFDAGRNLFDRLSASASCPQGDKFETLAHEGEIDQYKLSSLWKSKDCKNVECKSPKISLKAANALAPAYRALTEGKHSASISMVDTAITNGAVMTEVDYATALYIRVRALLNMKELDIAAVDAERFIKIAPINETAIEPLRLLVASKAFKEKNYTKADDQIRQIMESKKTRHPNIVSLAAISAIMMGETPRAFSYLRHGDNHVSRNLYASLYKYAITADRRDAAADIAEFFAADYGVSIEEAHAVMKKSNAKAINTKLSHTNAL